MCFYIIKKLKLQIKQILPKYLKSVSKSIVCKFTDELFESVNKLENINYIIKINKYLLNPLINSSINLSVINDK